MAGSAASGWWPTGSGGWLGQEASSWRPAAPGDAQRLRRTRIRRRPGVSRTASAIAVARRPACDGVLSLDPPTEPGVWSLSGEAAVVASGREGAAGLPGFSTVIPLVGTDLAVR